MWQLGLITEYLTEAGLYQPLYLLEAVYCRTLFLGFSFPYLPLLTLSSLFSPSHTLSLYPFLAGLWRFGVYNL